MPQSRGGFLPQKISYPLILIYCSLPTARVSRTTNQQVMLWHPYTCPFPLILEGSLSGNKWHSDLSSTSVCPLPVPEPLCKSVATLGDVPCLLQSHCPGSMMGGCSHVFPPPHFFKTLFQLFAECFIPSFSGHGSRPGSHFLPRGYTCISPQQ